MGNLPFQPPPGLTNNDTVFSAPGRWANGSLVRFFNGNWEVKGGWERLTLTNLSGVCRSVIGWQDPTSQQNIAFGLHNGLKAWRGGLVYDITPLAAGPVIPMSFPANAVVKTTAGSSSVGLVVFGHNATVGQIIRVVGVTFPVGGNVNANGDWAVASIVDVNNLTITYTANATSTANGGGVAGTAQLAPFTGFVAGQIDGTGGAGYSTGAFGVGTYGTPSTSDYFPLTWSLATYGGFLIANPRNQGIYIWDTTAPGKATVITQAPAQVTFVVVTPSRQVLALGCNQEVGGVFNPLNIRWSDIEDYTDWTSLPTNNAGEWTLESGGRIVSARVVGDYVLVWTSDGLFMGTFLGDPGQTWKFERQGSGCGAISPGAPIVRGQRAAWISPDRMLWNYTLGGEPQPLNCDVQAVFQDHIAQGQDDKIVGSAVAPFQELVWFWPDDRDGLEVSRGMSVSTDGWSLDLLARSAFCDAGPQVFPIGVAPTGQVYWHEKGNSADGGILAGFLESGDFYLQEAEGGVMVNGVWPDFKNQIGPMQLTMATKENPQSIPRTHGPWTLAAGQGRRSFRVAGRIVRVRYDFASAPCYARGGKPEFQIEPIGGR
jgi:hypothetical protein